MKTKFQIGLGCMFLCVSLLAAKEYKGIVEIAEEDYDHKVIAVNLMVDDFSGGKFKSLYYRVDTQKGVGSELLTKVDAEIKAQGKVVGTRAGKKLLRITSYEVLTPSPEAEDPEGELGDAGDEYESEGADGSDTEMEYVSDDM